MVSEEILRASFTGTAGENQVENDRGSHYF